MGLAQRLVRGTQLDNGGPRNKNVLKSWARTPLQVERFDKVLKGLMDEGEIVMYSDRRGAVYGPPWLTRRRGQWVELATVPHAYRDDSTGVICIVCEQGGEHRLHREAKKRRR